MKVMTLVPGSVVDFTPKVRLKPARLPVEALDTPGEVRMQVLYVRRYELFGQGLRWEDLRRLSAYTSTEPSVAFLPYPQSECDRNPSAGC